MFFSFFENSNEEILGRQQKEEVLWWNVGNTVWGGGAFENPVRLSMYDSPVETVKYMCVNIWCMLDWIVGLAEIQFLGI